MRRSEVYDSKELPWAEGLFKVINCERSLDERLSLAPRSRLHMGMYMTALVVIKILIVGALLGGFVMFTVFRGKHQVADGKKINVFATVFNFLLWLVSLGAAAMICFWFVTKFLA